MEDKRLKVRILIETYLQKVFADEKRKYESELDGLKGQKAALENKRKKLLEAHYSDAIPLDLMKTEQQKIAKELAAIDHEIDLHNITFEQISANLDMVLDIVENCGEAYRNASDTIKKLMNQAKKLLADVCRCISFRTAVTIKALRDLFSACKYCAAFASIGLSKSNRTLIRYLLISSPQLSSASLPDTHIPLRRRRCHQRILHGLR